MKALLFYIPLFLACWYLAGYGAWLLVTWRLRKRGALAVEDEASFFAFNIIVWPILIGIYVAVLICAMSGALVRFVKEEW